MSKEQSSPPSYESAVRNVESSSNIRDSDVNLQWSQRLFNSLNTTRQRHIRSLISGKILPVIQHRAEKGLSQTSIALLPTIITKTSTSNQSELACDPAPEKPYRVIEIVSGHDGCDDLEHIELTTEIDNVQFWSQPFVVNELRHELKAQLYASATAIKPKLQHMSPPLQSPTRPISKTRSLFSRKSSSKVETLSMSIVSSPQNRVPTTDVSETIVLNIQQDEICLRTQSEFGLYETLTRPALIVHVEIRG